MVSAHLISSLPAQKNWSLAGSFTPVTWERHWCPFYITEDQFPELRIQHVQQATLLKDGDTSMSLFTEFRFEMFPSDCAGGSRRWAHLSSPDQTRVSRLQSPPLVHLPWPTFTPTRTRRLRRKHTTLGIACNARDALLTPAIYTCGADLKWTARCYAASLRSEDGSPREVQASSLCACLQYKCDYMCCII